MCNIPCNFFKIFFLKLPYLYLSLFFLVANVVQMFMLVHVVGIGIFIVIAVHITIVRSTRLTYPVVKSTSSMRLIGIRVRVHIHIPISVSLPFRRCLFDVCLVVYPQSPSKNDNAIEDVGSRRSSIGVLQRKQYSTRFKLYVLIDEKFIERERE